MGTVLGCSLTFRSDLKKGVTTGEARKDESVARRFLAPRPLKKVFFGQARVSVEGLCQFMHRLGYFLTCRLSPSVEGWPSFDLRFEGRVP